MSDISITITTKSEDHNATCEWCESSFTKRLTQKYCSDDCIREATALRYKTRYEQDYTYVPQKQPKRYQDYETPNLKHSPHQVILPTREHTETMKPIPVPELKYKRFKETKRVIVFTSNRERERESWNG